jgi:crotonobetainyl-CoA:carnitine CoA-transferase CaiB-like acyl-CoA transferase
VLDHPQAGRVTSPGAPYRFSATPWEIRRPAPLLGQHNGDVFGAELGVGQAELDALRAGGVV